ncbi:hypothetical protein F4561_003352 [Lipingzhangella halophila]|uniref:Uncharacterized protein n=1 Tax=Lipingzhangella halophila TaxID=1783352 RepID=A0A7W7W303_9ACTN|nr:hypothetical protein [Lipingzhangella halophila]
MVTALRHMNHREAKPLRETIEEREQALNHQTE